MSKRKADDDDAARKRLREEPAILTLPAEIIETIALAAGPREYRALAATCSRTRRLMTQDAARQERAKQQFSHIRRILDKAFAIYSTAYYLPNVVKHGVETLHDRAGHMLARIHWVDGKKHGLEERWSKSGILTSLFNNCHGKRHGVTQYVAFGDTWTRNYHADRLHGLSRCETSDGITKCIENYKHGVEHGEHTTFSPAGMPVHTKHYIDGKRDGLEQFWTPDGVLIRTIRWDDGELLGVKPQ